MKPVFNLSIDSAFHQNFLSLQFHETNLISWVGSHAQAAGMEGLL